MQGFRALGLALTFALVLASRVQEVRDLDEATDFGVLTVVEGTSSTHLVKQKNTNRYLEAFVNNDDGNDFRGRTDFWLQTDRDAAEWIFTCVDARRGEYTIQHRVNRRYMDAYEQGEDHSVKTNDWQDNDSQIWIVTQSGDGYRIQQKSTERYLDAHETARRRFGIHQHRDHAATTRQRQGNDSQIWLLDPRRLPPPASYTSVGGPKSSTHTMMQKNTRRYLQAYQDNEDHHDYSARTRRNREEGDDSQEWIFTCVSSTRREYTIQHKVNRRYLDAYETIFDQQAVTRNWQRDNSQVWILTPVQGGYTIQQKKTMRYLDAFQNDEYRSVTRPEENNDSQIWILNPSLNADVPLTAKGAWESVGGIASGGSQRTVTIGTTSTEAHNSTFHTEVVDAVSSGFALSDGDGGWTSEVSRTATVGSEMSRSSAFHSSSSQTTTQSFIATTRGRYLWQWVFHYERQGEDAGATMMDSFAQTAGRWEPPACLPGFARDQNDGAQDCVSEEYRIR